MFNCRQKLPKGIHAPFPMYLYARVYMPTRARVLPHGTPTPHPPVVLVERVLTLQELTGVHVTVSGLIGNEGRWLWLLGRSHLQGSAVNKCMLDFYFLGKKSNFSYNSPVLKKIETQFPLYVHTYLRHHDFFFPITALRSSKRHRITWLEKASVSPAFPCTYTVSQYPLSSPASPQPVGL